MDFSLPPPAELGFAAKFIDWRPEQLDGINFAIEQFDAGKRVVAISAPTGSGKSLMAMTIAQLTPGVRRAVYLTSTKGLEDQVERDFRGIGAFDIRGQRNYPCLALDTGGEHAKLQKTSLRKTAPGCDEGPCHFGLSCSLAPERGNSPSGPQPACSYYGAVWSARRSTLVVTNYAYWMSINEHGGGIGEFDLIILDEGHHADQELEKFLTFKVTEEDAWRARATLPSGDSAAAWRGWAGVALPTVNGLVEDVAKPDSAWQLDEIRQLKETQARITRLSEIEPKDWVVEAGVSETKFSPINVGRYANSTLLQKVPKVLILSATLTRKAVHRLGIASKDMAFSELPSSFPVERRPVRLITAAPQVWVDSKHSSDADFYSWTLRIDNLIRPRIENGSGIIHTVSYARAKFLLKHSRFKDRMIMHDSRGTIEAVERFKNAKEPVILVSPSIHTGYDFPYEAARWQIIGKLPFPDSRGPIMEARAKDDKEYFAHATASTLQQMAGRIVRAEDDWGETLIVDMNMSWFVNRYGYLFTRSFLDAYEELAYLPQPLEFSDEE